MKQYYVKGLCVLTILFSAHFSVLSQKKKEPFQPSYKSRIDLSFFVLPHKLGLYQNYEMYTQMNLKGRFGIGASMFYLIIDPKYDFSGHTVDYRFSIGPTIELLDVKRINLMTYSHLVYHNAIGPFWPTTYYAGGYVQGLRCDFRIGQFGVGVKSYFQISYGSATNINYPQGIWVYDLRYGFALNLTYFITK